MSAVRLYPDRKLYAQEIEIQKGFFHEFRKLPGCRFSGFGELIAGLLHGIPGLFDLSHEAGTPLFIRPEKVQTLPALFQGPHNFPDRRAVLVLASPDHVKTVFNL